MPDDRVLAALQTYEGPLLRYAARILGDLDRARDVVQETFLKLWQAGADSIEGHEAEWLFTVCRNRALDVRRKERRMISQAEAEPGTAAPAAAGVETSPQASIEKKEDERHALAALDKLPERQQEVIRLKFQGGLSYREISRVTGLSESNVGYLIHTGLKAVREGLAGRRKP